MQVVDRILKRKENGGNFLYSIFLGDIDTTPVPMDLEPEDMVVDNGGGGGQQQTTNNNQVDIENELREFLEGGGPGLPTAAEVEHDTASIEQMLLD